MKEVVGHVYGNTRDQVKEIINILENAGYEIAYENDQKTSAAIIEEIADDE